MHIPILLCSTLLFITAPIMGMENNYITSSKLINLPKEITLGISAYCLSKNALRATCKHFRDLASRRKNEAILKHPLLQLSEKALNHYFFYYGALGNTKIVHNLLDKGADPNTTDKGSQSLMHYAARYGYTDIATLLLKHPKLFKPAITQLLYLDDSPLALAIKQDQGTIVQQIITTCVVDKKEILCCAAKKGAYNVIQTLFTQKINPNCFDEKGASPLLLAGTGGHINVAKLLIKNDAHVNNPVTAKGYTCHLLSFASGERATNMVLRLLEDGADINATNAGNCTALHIASAHGHRDIVKILLDYNADAIIRDDKGATPLDVADTDEVKQLLMAHKETPKNTIKACMLNLANNHPIDLDAELLNNLTLYHGFVGNCTVVSQLLAHGVDPNIQDNKKMSLMHYAAQYGYLDIMDVLLNNPAFITTDIANDETSPLYLAMKHNQHTVIKKILETCDVHGGAALCHAIEEKLLDVVRILLACNVDPNYGQYPLWLAAMNGDLCLPIIKLLITNGACVNNCVNNCIAEEIEQAFIGTAPLHMAAAIGHSYTVQLLIENGADVNVKSNEGVTPLHAAAESGNVDIVEMLINNGAHVTAIDDSGKTALHYGVRNTLITKKLLECPDINVNERDNDGNTPLHIAVKNGYQTVALLLKHTDIIVNAQNNAKQTPLDLAIVMLNQHASDFIAFEIKNLLIKHGGKTVQHYEQGHCAIQ